MLGKSSQPTLGVRGVVSYVCFQSMAGTFSIYFFNTDISKGIFEQKILMK